MTTASEVNRSTTDKELLSAGEVAGYLGVEPVTVYRWCREGRLPCVKIGKSWRIRRAALDDFLQRGEQGQTLVAQLRAFYTIPDHVLAIAETEALLHRLDVAFFQAGEARGAMLVKFHTERTEAVAELRAGFARDGLDVARLEARGQFRFVEERDPIGGRAQGLRRVCDELGDAGRRIWASFDWAEQIGPDDGLRQQDELAAIVAGSQMVVETGVVARIADDWPTAILRRGRQIHRGMIWITRAGLSMSHLVPLPPG
jgi:excisionase family DNA binding protein